MHSVLEAPEAWSSSDCGELPEQSSYTTDVEEKEVCRLGWLARSEQRKKRLLFSAVCTFDTGVYDN